MGALTEAVKELAADVRRWTADAAGRGGDALVGGIPPERSLRDAALASVVIFAVRFVMLAAGLFRERVPVTRAILEAAIVAVPVFVIIVAILLWRDRRSNRRREDAVDGPGQAG